MLFWDAHPLFSLENHILLQTQLKGLDKVDFIPDQKLADKEGLTNENLTVSWPQRLAHR